MDKLKQEEFMAEAKGFFNFYKKQIGEAARSGDSIVFLGFNDLASFSHVIAEMLLDKPEEILNNLEVSLQEIGILKNPRVRLLDLPEDNFVKIRNIRAKHLNKMLWIEGIVRQASDVRPQVVSARFECPSCGTIISVLQLEKKFKEPSRCSCGRKGFFKLISKQMVDAQRLVIEESSESLVGGEQPRRVNVFLKEDLVDPKMEERTTPGSKVRVIGILNEVPVPLQTGSVSTRFDLAVDANHIIPLEESYEELKISEEDEMQIKELSMDPNIFAKLTDNIAPSIYGYEEVKQSLVLQLFGGVRKQKVDGTVTRGDIHILLVGDPGVAKSITLKFISKIAPKGRYVVGRSASGAGLTATVVRDEFLKGWSLEAGAMVLSNKGIVCIDEIEKMDEQDRSAMHEAMEQQCYLPNFNLTFADGSKAKIGEFVDGLLEENRNKILNGINCEILPLNNELKILTTDFESIYPAEIDKVSRHIAPNKFVKINLNNGRQIIVTLEHPCWVVKNGKITTIPAMNLNKRDFFPIPGELPIGGEEQIFPLMPFKNGPQLCKLLGYHITDGCYELNRGRKNGIQFSNNNKLLIEDYSNAIKSIFGINPLVLRRGNNFSVRVISKNVVEFMKNLDSNLLEKGSIKKIPDKIMKCKKEDISILLRAMFDGDGTVVKVKRGGCRIGLVCENIELAEQASELLLRFGILSSVYKDNKVFRLDIAGYSNLIKYYNYIGFLSEKKQKRLKDYAVRIKTYRSVNDVVPNITPSIKNIFKRLKINEEKYLGNQACMDCEKHRIFLQKMIRLCEDKIGKLLDAKEIIDNSSNSREMGEVRKKLEISLLNISKKLGISDYMLEQYEKKDIAIKGYQELMLKEMEEMLSILPELKEIRKLAFGKVRWARIKSVEIIENRDVKWVYDVAVEPNHSFISNNMILHNSVTISKANVQASLRAETSVLAAGNPKFGRFDPYQAIAQQIDIQPTLLNRFDVIFMLRDLPERARDEAIASHVLFEQQNTILRGSIEPELFRKYIAYAKQKIIPKLSDEAVAEIKNFYVSLRNAPTASDSPLKPIPITARQLEALVRLSEASAKTRLSPIVEKDDALRAINLMKFYLMQAGYDYETKTFDIDKIVTGVTTSKRGKFIDVREAIIKLESKLGKLIPIEELEKELENRVTKSELDEAIEKLRMTGDIFVPKSGYIQRV
ncbi:hypothetical protein J4466_03225 [Candidatus Pacearchaeota archaeon]|nr:hypothetical protein [Candidatus Pacearchaeota archaeon]